MSDFDIRAKEGDRDFEKALRPSEFDSFSGQDKIVENLKIFVTAARMRGESLDHVLLHGPPGLGKTTLSNIIANELGVVVEAPDGILYAFENGSISIGDKNEGKMKLFYPRK